jgi:hypothetical protein
MQSTLIKTVNAENTTNEKCSGVDSLAAESIESSALISRDIDSLANIVAARKRSNGDLSIAKMIDSVGNRPAFEVPHQTISSDIRGCTEKCGDIGTVLWDGLSEWPTSGIRKPGDNDCLIGRGGA